MLINSNNKNSKKSVLAEYINSLIAIDEVLKQVAI